MATTTESDSSNPCIVGYDSSSSRRGPAVSRRRPNPRPPGSRARSFARRYRVLEGTSGYSTVYEFASTAVPESPEWKEQQQHSSPNSPRMWQVMTHAPGSAGVYVRVNP